MGLSERETTTEIDMSFIPSNTYNLLMDFPELGAYGSSELHAVPEDDLRRLVDAGCTVAVNYALWDIIEPQRGAYDWRYLDAAIEQYRRAGMKVIVFGPNNLPQWMPDEWYVWDADGKPHKDVDKDNPVQVWGCLSLWNRDAQGYQLRFIQTLIDRYGANDVQIAGCHSRDGESFLPPGIVGLYDPAALQDYRRFTGRMDAMPDIRCQHTLDWLRQSCLIALMRQQQLYAAQHGETWMQLHPHYARFPASGTAMMWECIDNLKALGEVNWLLYTHFPHTGSAWYRGQSERLQAAGAQVWTGSEWPEGLITNTPSAVKQGLRGLLTAPMHPFLNRRTVEPWVFDAFRNSREVFRRGAHG